jgi:4-hydroxybenzoate polyprenyltransferase
MSSATSVNTPAPRRRFDLVAYLKLFRFPLVFTAIADSAAGYLCTRSGDPAVLGLLALASGGLYLFGMALNDIADLEKDRQAAPNKVLPSGRISRRGAVVAATLLLLASAVGVVLIPEPSLGQRLAVWGGILLCILAYDLHWVKFPPVMGLVRALNLLLGIAVNWKTERDMATPLVVPAVVLPIFGYVTCLTFVSTLEDVAMDRRKVFLGALGMSVCAIAAALAFPFLVSWYGVRQDLDISRGLAMAGILVAWVLFRAWKARDRKGVMLMVRDGVAGIILVDAALVSPWEPQSGLKLACLLVPAFLSLQIFKRLA